MENNQKQGIQANSQYVINYLSDELAAKNNENAMLKAIIQEQNEKINNNESGVQE